MKAKGIAIRLAVAGLGALLPVLAAAQTYRPEGVQDLSAESTLALSLSLSDINQLYVNRVHIDFARGKIGTDRLAETTSERKEPWIVYARAYVLNYQGVVNENKWFQLDDSRVGLGRTGPAIAGRLYIGVRKRF